MLHHIPNLLSSEELLTAQNLMTTAAWEDGRTSAGSQAALVKNNSQLTTNSESALKLSALVENALHRNASFFAAALPKRFSVLGFNRYGQRIDQDKPSQTQPDYYGKHIDNAIRSSNTFGQRVRTDLSATLFLSSPPSYDGGELVVHDGMLEQRIKLAMGDLIVYPSTSLHQVTPVTRGTRFACFFWIESMVRRDDQRQLLLELDRTIQTLRATQGETPEAVALTGTYHNLLRMWADT